MFPYARFLLYGVKWILKLFFFEEEEERRFNKDTCHKNITYYNAVIVFLILVNEKALYNI